MIYKYDDVTKLFCSRRVFLFDYYLGDVEWFSQSELAVLSNLENYSEQGKIKFFKMVDEMDPEYAGSEAVFFALQLVKCSLQLMITAGLID